MQLVAAGGGLGEQVLVIQLIQVAAGVVQAGVVQRGGGVGVEAGPGNQAEPAEQPLLACGEVLVGQVERGRDRQVLGVHQRQPVPGRGQARRPGSPAVQAGWWRSWLASIPIASGRYPHSRVISPTAASPALQPGPGRQPGQQRRRLAGGKGVQADHRGVLQRGQPPAAGDQHQAARGAGQQRPDLLMPGRVIQQQQDLLARHVIAPPRRPGLQPGRDLRRGHPGGQQQAGQRIGRVDRPLPGGVGVQRQEELPVREAPGQPVRGVHREGGLADPGHPVDRVDAHHPAARGQARQAPPSAGRARPGGR